MKKKLALLLSIMICLFAAGCGSALVVDSAGDEPDGNLTDGVCKTVNNDCTLRAAIMEANVSDDVSNITFKNVSTIYPTSALPDLSASNTKIDGEGIVALDGSQISEESISGLRIYDSSYNIIQGLIIKNFHYGISVIGINSTAKYNVIGLLDTDPGDGSERNIIINNSVGIMITGSNSFHNTVAGNHIGIKANGSTMGSNLYGVIISNGASDNLIGTLTGEGILQGWNLISGNTSMGIQISEGFQNHISGNLIGTDINGTSIKANNVGINLINGSKNNIIGINGAGEGVLNLISGNSFRGIEISDQDSYTNIIAGNLIGTNLHGTAAIGNGGSGILVGGADNRIGTNGDGSFDQLEGNVISGNSTVGINLSSNGNQVSGNLIGVDITGLIELGNAMGGISIYGFDNLIGTNGDGIADEDERNIISANSSNQNSGSGIRIEGNSNTVAGNYIGTDVTGTAGLGNYHEGISLINGASGNLIGTDGDGQSDLIEGNLISGNGRAGVALFAASSNTIAGNFIGTDLTGTSAIPNGHNNDSGLGAVHLAANSSKNIIGTNSDGQNDNSEGNIISGNSQAGIFLTGPNTMHNILAGNYIGVDVTGSSVLGNIQGIMIGVGADYNTIGTNANGFSDIYEGNLIGGNSKYGISISGSFNKISGNFIGTDNLGTADLGNSLPGISVTDNTTDNVIGGSIQKANIIAFNKNIGVSVSGLNANNVEILYNSIHSNDRNGISLDGPVPTNPFFTPNDPGDIDLGPNDLMNYPVLTKATTIPASVSISGSIFNGLPGTSFVIQFFDNDVCDPYGYHGEGKTYLGSITQLTDSNGNAIFSTTFGAVVPAGHFITATATADKKTSEFSECIEVTEGQVTYSQELEENLCDQFNQDEMSIMTFEVRPESGQFIFYIKNSFPYPITGPEGELEYSGLVGEFPADCNFQGFDDRLYCSSIIPASIFNTKQTVKIFSNLCLPPFYVDEVSIFSKVPADPADPAKPSTTDEPDGCHSGLDQRDCIAAGGTYIEETSTCVCPRRSN